MTAPRNQIMLVDDEPRLLSALRRRLSSEYDIVTFENGNSALDYLKNENNVAVIIADMQMPQMNGIELLVEVQKIAPNVRRLMLTGNSDQETAMSAINDGKISRFIRKPCEAENLKKIINQALEDYIFNQEAFEDMVANQTFKNVSKTARTTFLSVMNDELRTPLNHIIGMTRLLVEHKEQVDAAQIPELLNQISESGEHLLSLVDRILKFTKLQSSDVENEGSQKFNIVELVRNEIKNIEQLATKNRVSISVDSGGTQYDVFGNRDEVSLALHELISNAVKFNNLEGHVSIIVKSSEHLVAVRISDSGPGIPKELKAELMGPFTQVDGSLARTHAGVGLGLALVGSIANQNDLYFDINDAKGGGTAATLVCKRAGNTIVKTSKSVIELLKAS
ncbi:MAG: hybrid sensor histidine kinase/response regulator [Hellea sp.]